MKCIEDAADIGVVTAGGKIVVEFLDKTIYNERSQRCRMAPPVFEEREDRLLKKGKIKIIALDRGICTDRIDRGTNKPSFEQ